MSTPTFRQAVPSDADRCFEIEISAYEGDEAATREKIATRISQYPQGFLVMELDGRIVGFINGGCAHDVVMSDEAFKELIGHDPAAPNVVIMSVVIDPAYQGRGFASLMMRTFVAQMAAMGKETIHLMCKERHVALYEKLGYRYVRPSSSDHGGMTWHEMDMTLCMIESELTCPHCGFVHREPVPTESCLFFYECLGCHALLRPKHGDCCVFCSFGSVPCPFAHEGIAVPRKP